MKQITGYSDRLSVAPGDAVRFMVSCERATGTYRADIVRIICGDADAPQPGFKEVLVDAAANGVYPARHQPIHAGSFAVVPPRHVFDRLTSFTLAAFIWPTTPERGRQTLLGRWCDDARAGFALIIDDAGALALLVGDGEGGVEAVSSGKRLLAREWYLAGASYDASEREVVVYQRPKRAHPRVDAEAFVRARSRVAPKPRPAEPVLIGAHTASLVDDRVIGAGHYNGKLERPTIANRALGHGAFEALARGELDVAVIARWDFSREIPTDRIADVSPNGLHGRTINLPTRAVTGYDWDGTAMSWPQAPHHYGAVHFHEDDLYDAGWQVDFELAIPEDMPSGVYAARLRTDEDEDYIPFFVRPSSGARTSKVALLACTATYMAYANNHTATDAELRELARGELIKLRREDLFLNVHREYGLSTYDVHADGSGVCYSSRLRPILNMRPKGYLWNFNADTHITDWLEAIGERYDVITDEDLHREGVELLVRHRVVLTGTHPEYCSTAMWDALRAYLDRGGRLMYMGGNGFYWRAAYHPELPGVIEVRRGATGTRGWSGLPGEQYHSFTGEHGGLWREQGRPPQTLVGVGYNAQGFDAATCFWRRPASFDPRARFIFRGIAEDEPIGDFGRIYGGAAGSEIDRHDRALGSPPHALVLASSRDHSNVYYPAVEDTPELMPALAGPENDAVRADMVFFETPNGGAVFATGSIAWSGSLSHNGYDNNVSRITRNVLERFKDEARL